MQTRRRGFAYFGYGRGGRLHGTAGFDYTPTADQANTHRKSLEFLGSEFHLLFECPPPGMTPVPEDGAPFGQFLQAGISDKVMSF